MITELGIGVISFPVVGGQNSPSRYASIADFERRALRLRRLSVGFLA
jgi:hypothetical protein